MTMQWPEVLGLNPKICLDMSGYMYMINIKLNEYR